MRRSYVPLKNWFRAVLLATGHFNGISALQLKDRVGVDYKAAWLLLRKLRKAMKEARRACRSDRGIRSGLPAAAAP